MPRTEAKKLSGVTLRAPSAAPFLLKEMNWLFRHTRIWAGPTSPMVSGGQGPTEDDEAWKFTPVVCAMRGAGAVLGTLPPDDEATRSSVTEGAARGAAARSRARIRPTGRCGARFACFCRA